MKEDSVLKNIRIIGGVDEDDNVKELKINEHGELYISGEISVDDIDIGAVKQGEGSASVEPWRFKQFGGRLEEQLNQDNADTDNILSFEKNIIGVEIYHEEDDWQTFEVNGISLQIAAKGWARLIGGTPSNEVKIPADVDCTVARLE